jgi:hypothetical protein
MQTPHLQRVESRGAHLDAAEFTSLVAETRHAVDTDCAAFHLNRQPQTLRYWACYETGPVRPIRINGRLAWPVADLRRVLGVQT